MEITLAIIVTLVTLLSTVLSTFITKQSDMKMKKVDIQYNLTNSIYSNSLEVFQNFVCHSSSLLDKINSGLTPNLDELERFDHACVSCFLYLDDKSRNLFQTFRIEVKVQIGFLDPRETNVLNNSMDKLGKALGMNGSAIFIKPESKLYKLFNRCINVASKRIESITTDMKEIYNK